MKFFINTSCAAGTGSFLEEQASRLSIDIKDISAYTEKATEIPRIAGRCSVFDTSYVGRSESRGYLKTLIMK